MDPNQSIFDIDSPHASGSKSMINQPYPLLINRWQVKAFLGESLKEDLAKSIRSMGRSDARFAMQLITEHGITNYHLYKMDCSDVPVFKRYVKEDEISLLLGQYK